MRTGSTSLRWSNGSRRAERGEAGGVPSDDGGEGGGLRLDGIYVEYERGMLATPETRARLAALRAAAGGVVGVWAHPHQPDDTLRVARALVDAGVTYVNTDFQAAFLG